MVIQAPALAAIVGLGAVGGIIANIALTPLSAGAGLLQSYWYGSGLILGERMMYTVHWEKIRVRLEKGEDFLTVLDKIMNDDITAIANLSFKAMDETGNLFLKKAGQNLGKFIEDLLAAAINPFFSGDREEGEPAPEGEETETGISLTIEQIQSMSVNTLLFETQANQISKYTEATQAHMLTELAKRNISTEQEEVVTEEIRVLRHDLYLKEADFLVELFTFQTGTIANLYANFITKFPSEQQDLIILSLKQSGINGVFTTRHLSAGSNDTLKSMRDSLNVLRNRLLDQINANNLAGARTQQGRINALHITIVLWQMIYT